uniref:Uncharacterized protein n=1 Tax=Mesocestoides corti TaxID=53468 RepID=A0A5K3FX70_MESCO
QNARALKGRRPVQHNRFYGLITSQTHRSDAFHPSPQYRPHCSIYTAPHSCLSLVGCVSSSHAIGTQTDPGLAKASIVQYVCALNTLP